MHNHQEGRRGRKQKSIQGILYEKRVGNRGEMQGNAR